MFGPRNLLFVFFCSSGPRRFSPGPEGSLQRTGSLSYNSPRGLHMDLAVRLEFDTCRIAPRSLARMLRPSRRPRRHNHRHIHFAKHPPSARDRLRNRAQRTFPFIPGIADPRVGVTRHLPFSSRQRERALAHRHPARLLSRSGSLHHFTTR
jgi:hypothetical protein